MTSRAIRPNAKLAYEHGLALKPNEPAMLNNYAMSRMLAGDPAGARTLLMQAQASGSTDPRIASNLALLDSTAPVAPAAAAPAAAPTAAPPRTVASNAFPHRVAPAGAGRRAHTAGARAMAVHRSSCRTCPSIRAGSGGAAWRSPATLAREAMIQGRAGRIRTALSTATARQAGHVASLPPRSSPRSRPGGRITSPAAHDGRRRQAVRQRTSRTARTGDRGVSTPVMASLEGAATCKRERSSPDIAAPSALNLRRRGGPPRYSWRIQPGQTTRRVDRKTARFMSLK